MFLQKQTIPAPLRMPLHVLYVFLAMAGWRIDYLNVWWIVLGGASFALAKAVQQVGRPSALIGYSAVCWAFYYVGNTYLLKSKWPRQLIEKYGEDRAWRIYHTICALMFINQGLGLGALSELHSLPFPLPHSFALAIGAALFVFGVAFKVWTTVILGIDVYYYKDMFVNRAVSQFTVAGPYRYLANPMYGVGQAPAYALAIISQSTEGLIGAFLFQISIYGFYFLAERPFIGRVYLQKAVAKTVAKTLAKTLPDAR